MFQPYGLGDIELLEFPKSKIDIGAVLQVREADNLQCKAADEAVDVASLSEGSFCPVKMPPVGAICLVADNARPMVDDCQHQLGLALCCVVVQLPLPHWSFC
ncbi:MAG: hypothetical protein JOY71_08255 [Acetobacteraceae bacterium]|nr:hypothetical protein [Acetobacteraceae bacterium]